MLIIGEQAKGNAVRAEGAMVPKAIPATMMPVAVGALGLALCALMASYGGRMFVYDRPGVTPEQRARDENACLRAEQGRLLAPYRMSRGAVDRCMAERGYERRRTERRVAG
jgi:hypothetical protein